MELFLGSIVEIPHVSDIGTMLRIPNEAHGDIEWTKFVLEELSEPVWPPREPLLTLVERLENIVQSFHAHSYSCGLSWISECVMWITLGMTYRLGH